MSYRRASQKLKELEPKKLTSGWYQRPDGTCCAIGAIAPSTRHRTGNIVSLIWSSRQIYEEFHELRMDEYEAATLQVVNDKFNGTDEDRYAHVLAFVESRGAEEPS